MKKYIQPRILMEGIIEDELIIATSGEDGVTTGGKLGNGYNSSDVSYSKGRSAFSADYSLSDGWE